ncbi:amino acid permease [Lanmaoa asiatica]|nr:amino acid permease [Lanmaoa asiatica]
MSSEKDTTKVSYGKSSDTSLKDEEYATAGQPQKLHRQLKNRHVAMISIGGVIGTGLFVGTANSLKNGGPVGLLLGYIAMGSIVLAVMVSLGEMIAYLPIAGGHIQLAGRFVNPALSFAMGWNYWYNWVITAELSAATLLIDYWHPNVNNAVWIAMCIFVAVTINMFGAGAYGEAEFIFASIKVLTITGLIILGIVLDLGGGPNHDRIGFRYWKNPGPFAQYKGISGPKGQFLGWWSVLDNAAFSFLGTEIVAIAAAETKNPRRNLPRAIRRVYVRILLFYILGTLIIGLLVPFTNSQLGLTSGTAAASPFVIAIETAGIKSLPSIINACLLTSAWSAASSDLYTSSRALYGLAIAGNAPKFFGRTSKSGLPYTSVIFCASFTLLAFMAAVQQCWTSLRLVLQHDIRCWPLDLVCHLPRGTGAIATFVICLFNGWSVFLKGNWDTANFLTSYLPCIIFPLLYIGARFYYRSPPLKPEEMDFLSDIAQIEADEAPDSPPKNKVEAFWMWLM